MRLCNPDNLIEWRDVPPPKYKKDYEGKLVRVAAFTHRSCFRSEPALPPDGAVCAITRRGNDYGGGVFKLTLQWRCPACNKPHEAIIPEDWIIEGKAAFVEAEALADYSHALAEHEPAPMLYLAAPYSDPDAAKRGARAHLASQCAGWLMHRGYGVVSPLSMGHAVATEAPTLDGSFARWRDISLRMLEVCDGLCVLLLDGVRDSVGVAAEIAHARRLGIPCNQISLGSEDGEFAIVPAPTWWRL